MNCPHCQSSNLIKNGKTKAQKQRYKCGGCGRTFTPGGAGHRLPLGDTPMSSTERSRRSRERKRKGQSS